MDQTLPDDVGAVRDERRLLLEEMWALHDQMAILDMQHHEVDGRLQRLQGQMRSAEGLALLREERALERHMADVIQKHQVLLHRYQDLYQRRSGPSRMIDDAEQSNP